MSGVPVDLLVSATTGTSAALAIPPSFTIHAFLVRTPSGVSAGAITVEASNDPSDTNTWAAIVPDKSILNPLTVVAGADLLMPYTGRLNFVRARINTTISGGTQAGTTVTYEGAKGY